ncbi:hypothetical protein F5Y05DRAFT_369556 [Hypoxylon sp. FL0543]|nr:hypothetical protein F5Y05DRAFT_369556 [Hypoxylon sp. FL0543]
MGDEAHPLLSKLAYMTTTFGQPNLGLSDTQCSDLSRSVDAIVYNSWRLDFGLALKSFDPFLQALQDLIRLSASSTKSARIVFISSQSSVARVAREGIAPEAPVHDALAAPNFGYAQSKLVAERVLALSGVAASVIRVCQLGGPTSAYPQETWAEQRWLSDMIRTSKTLGCAPEGVSRIDWAPVDSAASAIHDVIVSPTPGQEQEQIQFFNLISPSPQPWTASLKVLRDKLGVHDTVPLRDWVAKLRGLREKPMAKDVADLPALKMLDYWEAAGDGLEGAEWETENMRRVSRTEIPCVNLEMVEGWLADWNL